MMIFCAIVFDFNPRSHKGSDNENVHTVCMANDFNPRSHKGSDAKRSFVRSRKMQISIHAPTRGATRHFFQHQIRNGISIHAPTRGATSFSHLLSHLVQFQSTLPQGERLLINTISSYPTYFNPRSHKGSDADGTVRAKTTKISIHAPTRGATVDSSVVAALCVISIHAPTRGATLNQKK